MATLRTPYQQQKEKKDQRVYKYYQSLLDKPGAMITAVERQVMKRYKIHSRSTIHDICKRVEARQSANNQEHANRN